MFSQTDMPSTLSVLSAYTTLAASAMVVRTIVTEVRNLVGEFIPRRLQDKIIQALRSRFGHLSSTVLTLVIDEFNGFILNEVYQASETYLRTKLTSPSVERLRVSKAPQEHKLFITVGKDQEIIDDFRGIQLKWKQISIEKQKSTVNKDGYSNSSEKKCFELSFHKKHKEVVLTSYLTHVVEISKLIKQENKVVKLRSAGNYCGQPGQGSINLNHPSTFDTLAMDPHLKKELMDDLDRFVKRKELYRRVGKAWKRGYLLYGPPGTGKSSLVAAMANYLKFDIFDLELATLRCNSNFKSLLTCTTNRSIIVIEDIDCSVEMQDRGSTSNSNGGKSKLTLSGLLNFVDGLWSCCGDGRIIVFTTNHMDRLDPALLRPGRMDMHIHMSYCTPCGFKLLANNYLGLQNHHLFGEIEETITEANVTPAEVAEELLRNDDAEIALTGVVTLLKRKRVKRNESNAGEEQESYQEGTKRPKTEEGDDDEKEVEKQKKKKRTTNTRRSKQPTRRGAR